MPDPPSLGADREVFARETVREEYFQLAAGTRGLLQTHERILVTGATLLTGVTGVAIAEQVDGLLLALPLMVGALALFAMRSMVEILALGGYRRAIEESIAATMGAPVVLWEGSIVPTFNSSIAVRAMHGLYAVGYVCGIVGAVFVLDSIDATPLGYIGYTAAAGLLTGVLVASLLAVSTAADRAYDVASDGLETLRQLYSVNASEEPDARSV